MPFTNSEVAGGGKLTRFAIQSPNYAAGSAGWTINRDGSAEFNNITVRGILDVIDASGAEIKADPSVAARFDITPPRSANYPSVQWSPGSVGGTVATSDKPRLTLTSPVQTGGFSAATMSLTGGSNTGSPAIIFQADGLSGVIGHNGVKGNVVWQNNGVDGVDMYVHGDVFADASHTGTTPSIVPVVVGYTESNTPSTGFTAETQTDSVTFNQVSGRLYMVIWSCAFQSTVSGDIIQHGLRQDTSGGTRLGTSRDTLPTGTIDTRFSYSYVYTATASGSKTIVGTCVRTGGTGTITRNATSTQLSQMIVIQIS